MGIISRLLGREKRATSTAVSDEQLARLFSGGLEEPWTGIDVNRLNIMGLPIVWACTRVLSETLASLPLITYRRMDGGKERATSHPLYDLLHIKPNSFQTAFQFKEQMQSHLCIYGNAYAQIITDGTGYVKELIPLNPTDMTPEIVNGKIVYKYTDPKDNKEYTFPKEKIFHVAGFGFDGVQGYSPLALNSQTFGLALAAKRYAAEFYKNNGIPSFIIKHPAKISAVALERMKKSFDQGFTKWGNKHKTLILEEGMDTKDTQLPQDKAQFLETQKFLITEICRLYRIQPHIVQDLERSTNNNIEHQGLEFVTYTMQPWAVRWEQAASLQLLSERDRKRYFSEFLMDSLLRGDVQSRWMAYRTAMEIGAFSANEIRERENLNSRENGDTFHVPTNWRIDDGKNPPPPVPFGGNQTENKEKGEKVNGNDEK